MHFQTKLALTTAILFGVAGSAHAQLFSIGTDFTVSLTNSPTTETDVIPFTPGTQVLAGGLLDLTISIVPVAGGAEWVVFDAQTTSATQPLSLANEDWSIENIGIPAAVPVNFIADYTQWQGPTGANIPQTGTIFGQTLMASPVPGVVGNGEGNSGFIDVIGGPGALPQLGGFSDPFNIVLTGLPATQVNGEIAALEFSPQSPVNPVPEPSTWAMLLVGFAGLGYAAYRRSSRSSVSALA
jgi:hypothetical protein